METRGLKSGSWTWANVDALLHAKPYVTELQEQYKRGVRGGEMVNLAGSLDARLQHVKSKNYSADEGIGPILTMTADRLFALVMQRVDARKAATAPAMTEEEQFEAAANAEKATIPLGERVAGWLKAASII